MQIEKKNFQLKKLFNDSIWSIIALVLMNVVGQFVVYPIWLQYFNDEIYGNIVYCMSIINIFAVSFGTAGNYARMKESSTRNTKNGDYNQFLIVASGVAFFLSFIIIYISNMAISVLDIIFASTLCVVTTWRFYADVEYRLSLNYFGYFKYYAVISGGYICGIAIFRITGIWATALLLGEILGLIYVLLYGGILKKDFWERSEYFNENIQTITILSFSNIISNVIFNGDRLVLQNFLGGTAVTIYYLASLVGKTMSLITTPLNSVIIGYLSHYKENVTKKMVICFTVITLGAIIIGTFGAVIGSYILIGLIYPEQILHVKAFFIIANLTQVIYFVTNIVTTVLLRFAKTNCQLIINLFYAIGFIGVGIPSLVFGDIWGFCLGLLLVNVIRYVIAIGYFVKIGN